MVPKGASATAAVPAKHLQALGVVVLLVGFAGICRDLSGFVGLCWAVSGFVGICQDISGGACA